MDSHDEYYDHWSKKDLLPRQALITLSLYINIGVVNHRDNFTTIQVSVLPLASSLGL